MDVSLPADAPPSNAELVATYPEVSEVSLRGRPSKYLPEFCERVIDYAADGASLTAFAAEIGVSRKTLTVWAEAHAEFAEAVSIAKAKCAAWWERQAREVAKGAGGPGAASMCQFGLKNLAPEDWQDRQQHEHIGRVQHQMMTPEEALEEAARRGLPMRVLEE